MPSITQLQYIVAVGEHRHFAKAAKTCHVSQPSMSMQIQKAEDELGIQIFDRQKKPVGLTDKGKVFILQAKAVLYEHEKLIQLAKHEFKVLSGDFRLGVIPTLASYLLPLFLQNFSQRFPNVCLKIDEFPTEEIMKSLDSDLLDGAILATPLGEARLSERILCYEPFFLFLHRGHDLLKKKKIGHAELTPEGIWLLKEGHCLRNQVINFCTGAKQGPLTNVVFEGGSLETLVALVERCGGYTLLPDLMSRGLSAEQKENLRSFENPMPSREISLIFRKGHWKEDLVDALADTIKSSLPKDLARKDHRNQKVISIYENREG